MKFSLFCASFSLVNLLAQVNGDNHCYTTSSDILTAQVGGEKTIVICPNTTISVGIPTDSSFSDFVNGDVPLTALGDDVTIQCGDDGSSSNDCVVEGGLVQFATSPGLAQVPDWPTITTNNLRVQGLTFTGELRSVPGAGDVNIILSTAGLDMVFDDCVFTNVVASQVFAVDRNLLVPPEAFPPGVASVTIQNSVFRDITYSSLMIENRNQMLALDSVSFENIYYEPAENTEEYQDSVIYAGSAGSLAINNCVFTNVEFKNSIAFVRGDKTIFLISNNAGYNWRPMAGLNATETCAEGLIVAFSDIGELDLTSDRDNCLALTDEPVETDTDDEEGTIGEGEEISSDEGGSGSIGLPMSMNAAFLVSTLVVGALSWM